MCKECYINSLRCQRLQSSISKGRFVEKTKELFRIRAITKSGALVSDHEQVATALMDSYSSKFGSRHLQRREALLNFIRSAECVLRKLLSPGVSTPAV